MADGPRRVIAAFFQKIRIADLRQIHDRSPEVRRKEKLRPAEVGWRDANDREGMLVHLYDTADYVAVAVEIAVPQRIAQNDLGHAVLAMLFRGMNKPAQVRLNAERVKIITADQIGPHNRGISLAGIEPHATPNVVHHQRIEAAV